MAISSSETKVIGRKHGKADNKSSMDNCKITFIGLHSDQSRVYLTSGLMDQLGHFIGLVREQIHTSAG